jgi:type IV pilus assembly protein PilA
MRIKSAFTLLELLLVIAVIAILAGIILVALNPAERLQDANTVKTLSNSKDIEKALQAYIVDNAGQYPSDLQNKFSNGQARVDLCVSGQSCGGVDLNDELVTSGYLGSLPANPTKGNLIDTGYDVIYNSRTNQIKVVESPEYLLRDDFLTNAAAPIVLNRIAEPGPGNITIVDSGNIWSIANGKIVFGNGISTWGTNYVRGPAMTRTLGLSVFGTFDSGNNNRFSYVGWHSTPVINQPAVSGVLGMGHDFSVLRVIRPLAGVSTGAYDQAELQTASVLRSNGGFVLTRKNSIWTMQWVENTGNTTTLYPALNGTTNNPGCYAEFDNFNVRQLSAPWNTDYGIATDRKIGSVPSGTTFNHNANALIEFTLTTRPTSGQTEIHFRKLDSNNYWQVSIDSSGNLDLDEIVGGVLSQRATVAGVVTSGERIVIITDGSTVYVHENNTLAITYSSASNFSTVGNGYLNAVGTAGVVSELVTWPRIIPVEIAEQLD